jgi:hypothetical protein
MKKPARSRAWPIPSAAAPHARPGAARPTARPRRRRRLGRHRPLGERRDQSRRDREVGGRIAHPVAAGDVEIDFGGREAEPQRASSTARIIASRPESQPTTARRGVAPLARRTVSAWISTSTGRVPSSAGKTRRRDRLAAVGEEQGRGIGDLRQPPRPSRTRRSRRCRRSGSWSRAGCGIGGCARPRSSAPCRPYARARAARRSRRPW